MPLNRMCAGAVFSCALGSVCMGQIDPRDLTPEGVILPEAITSTFTGGDAIPLPMSPRLALDDGTGTIELFFRGSWSEPMADTKVTNSTFRVRALLVAGETQTRIGPKAPEPISRAKLNTHPEWEDSAGGEFFEARYAIYASDHGLYLQFGNEIREVPFLDRQISGPSAPLSHLVVVLTRGATGPVTTVYLDGVATTLQDFGLREGVGMSAALIGGMPDGGRGYVMFSGVAQGEPKRVEEFARDWVGEIGGVRIWSEPYDKSIVGGIPSRLRQYGQFEVERSVRFRSTAGDEQKEIPDLGELIVRSDFRGERGRHHVRLVDPIEGNWYAQARSSPEPESPLPGFDHSFGNFTSCPMVTIVPNVFEQLMYVDGILVASIFREGDQTLLEWRLSDWRGPLPRWRLEVASGTGLGARQRLRILAPEPEADLAGMTLAGVESRWTALTTEWQQKYRSREPHMRDGRPADETALRLTREMDEIQRRVAVTSAHAQARRLLATSMGVVFTGAGVTLIRPDNTWTGGNPEQGDNEFLLSMLPLVAGTGCGAFDITDMDPFYFASNKRGTDRYVLAQPSPRDFKLTAEKILAPTWFRTYKIPGASVDASATTTASEKQHLTALSASIGTRIGSPGIASFSASVKGQSENERGEAVESLSSLVSAYVRDYALVFDKANARLDSDFIHDVERVRDGGLTPEQFVAQIGTHYAYAVTFGGLGFLERTMDKRTYNEATMWGFDVEAEMAAGAQDAAGKSNFELRAGAGYKNQDKWNEMFQTDKSQLTIVGASDSLTFNADLASFQLGDPWPVFLDLRPIYELLTPAYFEDPRIYHDVRARIRDAVNAYLTRAADGVSDQEVIVPKRRLQKVNLSLELIKIEIDNGAYIVDANGASASNIFEGLVGSVLPRTWQQEDLDGVAELVGKVTAMPFVAKPGGTRENLKPRVETMLQYSEASPLSIQLRPTRRAAEGDTELIPWSGEINVAPSNPDVENPTVPLEFDVWVNADMDGDGKPDSDNVSIYDPSNVSFEIKVTGMLEYDTGEPDEELEDVTSVITPQDMRDGFHTITINPKEAGDPTVKVTFSLWPTETFHPASKSRFGDQLKEYEMLATAGTDTPMPDVQHVSAMAPFSGRWTEIAGVNADRLEVFHADGQMYSGYRIADESGRAGQGAVLAPVEGDLSLAVLFGATEAVNPAGGRTTLLQRADGTLRVAFEADGLVLYSGTTRLPVPLRNESGGAFQVGMLADLPARAQNSQDGFLYQRTMWVLAVSVDPAARSAGVQLRDAAGRFGPFLGRASTPVGFGLGRSSTWGFGDARNPPCPAAVSGMIVWHEALSDSVMGEMLSLVFLGQKGGARVEPVRNGQRMIPVRYSDPLNVARSVASQMDWTPGWPLFERSWVSAGLPTLPALATGWFSEGKDSTSPPMVRLRPEDQSLGEWLDDAFAEAVIEDLRLPAGAIGASAASLADAALQAFDANEDGAIDLDEWSEMEPATILPALLEHVAGDDPGRRAVATRVASTFGGDTEIMRLFAALRDRNVSCDRYELAAFIAFRLCQCEAILDDRPLAEFFQRFELVKRTHGLGWHGWRVRHGGPFDEIVTRLNAAQRALGLPESDIMVVPTQTGRTFKAVGPDGTPASMVIAGLPPAIAQDAELAADVSRVMPLLDGDGDGRMSAHELNSVFQQSGEAIEWLTKPDDYAKFALWNMGYSMLSLTETGEPPADPQLSVLDSEMLTLYFAIKREILSQLAEETPVIEAEPELEGMRRMAAWMEVGRLMWELRSIRDGASVLGETPQRPTYR